ncbi:hypothetical protein PSECIP111951_01481 [Pseudoalteromonas holothuriae]|uniref:DUF3581 domain-containing protein n=1 Tax=Pseudoalteromonas holothuriae TaxID=2963714 RepID=A0A9W4R1P5_9GAMM|nr:MULTISPECIES: DUF3581 domain-containing protein [unclassified Pseudoalteromonas]CAH9056534.1 hypothetical protein PSECIP111951_01481 [Pseudoalteromonas sp. CIP111951]CAH9062991.1 hypothetical protein PSECIP111854_03135 [Pseudoalteromonas sp. CIP111854]
MLNQFYQQDGDQVVISRQQASEFAKRVADDFNPLHDIDAKKFCVPGDLLFSLVLAQYGVSDNMHFTFAGMVDETSKLNFPVGSDEFAITSQDKVMLSVKRDGNNNSCQSLVESLTKSYVEFSGTTFPHVIIPLMAKQDVMINPARPMVIYESMAIHLDRLDLKTLELEADTPEFSYAGKRGKIILRFNLLSEGEKVGRGEKHMLVSGIRAYCQETVDDLIDYYNNRKATL